MLRRHAGSAVLCEEGSMIQDATRAQQHPQSCCKAGPTNLVCMLYQVLSLRGCPGALQQPCTPCQGGRSRQMCGQPVSPVLHPPVAALALQLLCSTALPKRRSAESPAYRSAAASACPRHRGGSEAPGSAGSHVRSCLVLHSMRCIMTFERRGSVCEGVHGHWKSSEALTPASAAAAMHCHRLRWSLSKGSE